MKSQTQMALPGISSLISATNELIRAAALNDSPVLVSGEIGTEKSFAAKLIHQQSRRAAHPLVKLTVSWKLPPNISEYFNQCDGGTLLINLQKDFPIDMQYTLVEMASHGCFADPMSGDLVEADVRMILMSPLSIEELEERSPLLPELRELLAAQNIEIPPLRSRTEDIPALVRYAIRRARETGKTRATAADPQVLALFRHWNWPGNTEDLLLVTAQAAIACKGETISISDIPESFLKKIPSDLMESSRALSRVPGEKAGAPARGDNVAPDTSEIEPITAQTGTAGHATAPAAPSEDEVAANAPTPWRRPPAKVLETSSPEADTAQARALISDTESAVRKALTADTRATRVLQLARRLNAQSQMLSRQMSGPLPPDRTHDLMDHIMRETSDDAALESLESELDRGLDLVMGLRRQLAILNVRQQQTQETIQDLVRRLATSGGSAAQATELAEETRELAATLQEIDSIVKRVADEMPRTGEHLESMIHGNLPPRMPSTSGIFRKFSADQASRD